MILIFLYRLIACLVSVQNLLNFGFDKNFSLVAFVRIMIWDFQAGNKHAMSCLLIAYFF